VPDLKAFPNATDALKICASNEDVATIVQTQAEEALASGMTATPSLRLVDNASGQSMVLSGQMPEEVLFEDIQKFYQTVALDS